MSDLDKAKSAWIEYWSGEPEDDSVFTHTTYNLYNSFLAGYQGGLPQWVPIAEIPDEWLSVQDDEFNLIFLFEDGSVASGDAWDRVSDIWACHKFYSLGEKVTHAMLPPSLPKGLE